MSPSSRHGQIRPNPFVSLNLRTFGGLTLTRGGSATGLAESRRKPLALLALVGAAGERGISRDKLAGYLWSESDGERARGVLKQTLYVLRKEFDGPEELFLGTTDLRLNPAAITVDLWEFERRAAAGDGAGAAACYTGHFLDGFHLSDAPAFDRWVDDQRDRLSRRMSAVLERLALEASGRNEPREAVDWWLRLTEHDPFDTRAITGLLHALLQAGDRPRALRYAERHMALIRKELDLTPDPEIRRLVDQARARPAPPTGDAGSGSPLPGPPVPPAPSALPDAANPTPAAARSRSATSRRPLNRFWLAAAATLGMLLLGYLTLRHRP